MKLIDPCDLPTLDQIQDKQAISLPIDPLPPKPLYLSEEELISDICRLFQLNDHSGLNLRVLELYRLKQSLLLTISTQHTLLHRQSCSLQSHS